MANVQIHAFRSDGEMSPGAAAALANLDVDASVQAYLTLNPPAGVVDAAAGTKGVLRLSGDLGGTAETPTVPGLASLDGRLTEIDDLLPGRLASTQPTVLLIGDSITAQNGHPGILNTADAYNARGFFNWSNWLMGERYNVVNVVGRGGYTSAQIAPLIDADLAANPSEWVVLECGTNDVAQSRTTAQIIASLTSCLDSIQAAGRRCCILTIWPSNNHTSAAMKQTAAEVSRWIAALPLTRQGVIVADAYSTLVNPATGTLGDGMTFDAVHPGTSAAYRAGVKVADAMRPFAPPRPILRVPDADPSNAIGNPSMLTNGAGWVVNKGTGATYTRDPDTFGNMVTITAAQDGAQVTYEEALSNGRIAIGDTLQLRARIRWSGLTQSAAMTLFGPWTAALWRSASGSFASTNEMGSGQEPSAFQTSILLTDVSPSGDVIVTSTKGTIPAVAADATPINRIYAQFGFRGTNLTGGTFTISDVSVRKVSP